MLKVRFRCPKAILRMLNTERRARQGGKRPYHTIIPALAKRGDDLWLSYGVMGGFMQPQGHVQVLLNMLRGYGPQAALDAPRFCISAGSPDSEAKQTGAAGDINSEVYFEEGISDETVKTLRGARSLSPCPSPLRHRLTYTVCAEMGHDARQLGGYARGMFGRGQVIEKIADPSGRTVWAAGSDLRADGHAAAQI